MKLTKLMIEVDVYCHWIDECEQLNASNAKNASGYGLGIMTKEPGMDEEDNPENDVSEEAGSSVEEIEEAPEVSGSEEEEKESKQPAKIGPQFSKKA